MFRTKKGFSLGTASAVAIAASLLAAGAASAQSSSSTLRGQVTDEGAAEAGAVVIATDLDTGYTSRATANSQGNYVLAGLRPGTYDVSVTTADGETGSTVITLGLGQVIVQDVEVGMDAYAGAEVDEIVVTGIRGAEVNTSEVATNVTQAQINTLPQINRNFLNFAALAPGVRVTEGETERTISAGGQPATAINVFIDGQNQKSTVVDGGVAGQDDSRGNPFPQGAVQEFRVISQNFKAEYEQAGSSIITAVTRSGTNEFEGEIFGTYQNEDWVEQDVFARRRGDAKPKLEREQYGFTFGGPIIRDTLHFFTSYERKDEARQATVFINNATYAPQFADQVGTFATPFEQDLFFGKLSWQINDRQLLDFSATYRTEEDLRDVGGANAPSRGTFLPQETQSYILKHQYQGDNFLNETSLDYFYYNYNQRAVNLGDYGREYVIFRDADNNAGNGFQYDVNAIQQTVFNGGGRSDAQFIEQESVTFKNDLTFTNLEYMGEHTVKMGFKYSDQSYFVRKAFARNPQFRYDIEGRPEINGDPDIPVRVFVGSDAPDADVSNGVYGLYIQDDWRINDHLEINLGLRWDYEDNAVNQDYVTPQAVRDMLTALDNAPGYDLPAWFNPEDYITDGDREAFKDAFQPRIGFSYDINADGRTVIFGGAGRYYDRIGFNFPFDERFKQYQFAKEIFFSADGLRPGTVQWDPIYLTADGLDTLLDASPAAAEVFLMKNDAPPPVTDQFNLGIRQKFGDWNTSATLSYAKTDNEFAWYVGNSGMDGGVWSGPTPASVGFTQYRDRVFISNHDRERRYKALYLQADKPYTRDSGWGLGFAYTLSEAEQNGSRDQGLGNFDFDYVWIDRSPWFPSATDERHRLVANGILDLPMDFQLSGIVTLGSGLPYHIWACPEANGGPCWNAGRPEGNSFFSDDIWAFRQVDLRLTKNFDLWNGSELEVFVDAINVFNFDNFNAFEQCMCAGDEFGEPRGVYLPTRSFQIGARYSF